MNNPLDILLRSGRYSCPVSLQAMRTLLVSLADSLIGDIRRERFGISLVATVLTRTSDILRGIGCSSPVNR